MTCKPVKNIAIKNNRITPVSSIGYYDRLLQENWNVLVTTETVVYFFPVHGGNRRASDFLICLLYLLFPIALDRVDAFVSDI